MTYDSTEDTVKHIKQVQAFIYEIILELEVRAKNHDASKLGPEEKPTFDKMTPKLKGSTYGSLDYKAMLAEMQPAIEHHNANNRHHPEHFQNGINGMNLIDLVEMICDWKAATLRHDNGNIVKSVYINSERFGMEEMVHDILLNTIRDMRWANDIDNEDI